MPTGQMIIENFRNKKTENPFILQDHKTLDKIDKPFIKNPME